MNNGSATLPKSFSDLVRESDLPVLVDFWAAWCGPCRMVAPVIDQIAREFKGRLRVVKIDVDKKPDISAQYGVQSIPTIMLFHQGTAVMRQSGAVPYETLRRMIEEKLKV